MMMIMNGGDDGVVFMMTMVTTMTVMVTIMIGKWRRRGVGGQDDGTRDVKYAGPVVHGGVEVLLNHKIMGKSGFDLLQNQIC